MAKLDAAYMQEVSKGFKRLFNDALKLNKEDYKKVATIVEANTATVDYAFIADMPSMREWIGERVLKELSAGKYTITKKNWESSIKVDRDVIIYDNLGIVKPKILSLVELVEMHYMKLVFSLLELNGNCYDGKAFFAKNHDIGGVSFSNKDVKPLTQENLLWTIGEMERLVSDEAEPLEIVPSLLVVPPELKVTAMNILKKEHLANGESNITYNAMDFVVSRRITNPKAWYLFDNTKALKPFILQINKKVDFTALDKPDSEANFMRREFRYGIDTEDNAGYGLWQMAYANIPA